MKKLFAKLSLGQTINLPYFDSKLKLKIITEPKIKKITGGYIKKIELKDFDLIFYDYGYTYFCTVINKSTRRSFMIDEFTGESVSIDE